MRRASGLEISEESGQEGGWSWRSCSEPALAGDIQGASSPPLSLRVDVSP